MPLLVRLPFVYFLFRIAFRSHSEHTELAEKLIPPLLCVSKT